MLIAGRDRPHAAEALRVAKDEIVNNSATRNLCQRLIAGDRRRVRRWGYALSYELGLLTPLQLTDGARADSDQWIRARSAEWLGSVEPQTLTALLDAKSVEVRHAALTRIRNTDLTDDALTRLLLDRAPRIRECAQRLAAQRGFEVAPIYRQILADSGTPARIRAACVHGLSAVGAPQDVPVFVEHLRDASPCVRAAAVGATVHLATAEVAVERLATALRDSSARVCLAAAKGLRRLNAPVSVAEKAWESTRYASRRAAWRFARSAGGWEQLEADLRAAVDSDPQLAAAGKAVLPAWAMFGAAKTWGILPDDQRERIAQYLAELDLDSEFERLVRFCADMEPPAEPPADNGSAESPAVSKRPRWFHVLSRRG